MSGEKPIPTFNFGREQSSKYFRNDFHGLGPEYLVGYSVFELSNVAGMLHTADVDLEILIASLASTLSRGQRVKLAMILGRLVTILDNKNHPVGGEDSCETTNALTECNKLMFLSNSPSRCQQLHLFFVAGYWKESMLFFPTYHTPLFRKLVFMLMFH